MDVDDHDELLLARLEEEMADVREQDVHPLLGAERRLVPDTVLVDLELAGNAFSFHRRAYEDVVQHGRSSV